MDTDGKGPTDTGRDQLASQRWVDVLKRGCVGTGKSETSSLLTRLIRLIRRLPAAAEAQAERVRTAAEVEALRRPSGNADAYAQDHALLRLQELESLAVLLRKARARIYVGFDKHTPSARSTSPDPRSLRSSSRVAGWIAGPGLAHRA